MFATLFVQRALSIAQKSKASTSPEHSRSDRLPPTRLPLVLESRQQKDKSHEDIHRYLQLKARMMTIDPVQSCSSNWSWGAVLLFLGGEAGVVHIGSERVETSPVSCLILARLPRA